MIAFQRLAELRLATCTVTQRQKQAIFGIYLVPLLCILINISYSYSIAHYIALVYLFFK